MEDDNENNSSNSEFGEKRVIEIKFNGGIHFIYPRLDIPDNYIVSIINRFDSNLSSIVTIDIDNIEWIYCLVGNIIDEHEFGPDKEIKHGTKHFAPGTKVYCFPVQWGDGYESIVVMGKPRKKFGLIQVVIRRKYVCNFRLKKVYDKEVIREMYHGYGWNNTEETKQEIIDFAKYLNMSIPLEDK
jgi:hypothetical protein